MKQAAHDPRWLSDPSPSWDELVEITGCGYLPVDTPESPSGDILTVTQKLWPRVHPALQERPS